MFSRNSYEKFLSNFPQISSEQHKTALSKATTQGKVSCLALINIAETIFRIVYKFFLRFGYIYWWVETTKVKKKLYKEVRPIWIKSYCCHCLMSETDKSRHKLFIRVHANFQDYGDVLLQSSEMVACCSWNMKHSSWKDGGDVWRHTTRWLEKLA